MGGAGVVFIFDWSGVLKKKQFHRKDEKNAKNIWDLNPMSPGHGEIHEHGIPVLRVFPVSRE
jgi:hypothetical protein